VLCAFALWGTYDIRGELDNHIYQGYCYPSGNPGYASSYAEGFSGYVDADCMGWCTLGAMPDADSGAEWACPDAWEQGSADAEVYYDYVESEAFLTGYPWPMDGDSYADCSGYTEDTGGAYSFC